MKKRVFLTSIITIAVLVVSCILLIIPGQFATIKGQGYNGYEVIFHFSNIDGINYLADNNPGSRASVAGILGLVFILFALASLIPSRKSPVLPIVGGAFTLLAGAMFMSMNLTINVVYNGRGELNFVPYLVGALLLFFGAALIILGAFNVKEQSKVINAKKEYSYLKSNKQK